MNKPHITARQFAALQRARDCHALAEAAKEPADKAAFLQTARAWEAVAGPGVAWSHKPLRRDMDTLKRDVSHATFAAKLNGGSPPPPPKPAAPAYVASQPRAKVPTTKVPEIVF